MSSTAPNSCYQYVPQTITYTNSSGLAIGSVFTQVDDNGKNTLSLGTQGFFFNTTNVYAVIFDLYYWLQSRLEIYQNSETFQHDFGKKLFSDAKSNLGKYLLDGAKPATELFKNTRVFDPLKIFRFFIHILKQSLDNFELEKWWLSHKTRLTILFEVARWYIKIPSSSCNSERALSLYKIIRDDTRQNMTELTIKINNFFYFLLTNDFFGESRDSEYGEEDIIPF
ncbi:unnamed protein product [Brachionus calyciflorus]|uniref:HAT C-terminal dimerisation domain-containing protein n=1 Tax=Brachionus calyciflorus TaxID=104777 RepID=A0A814IWJ5_9BILA|nr:unnamed protein product [Brachionus calyciflorus]